MLEVLECPSIGHISCLPKKCTVKAKVHILSKWVMSWLVWLSITMYFSYLRKRSHKCTLRRMVPSQNIEKGFTSRSPAQGVAFKSHRSSKSSGHGVRAKSRSHRFQSSQQARLRPNREGRKHKMTIQERLGEQPTREQIIVVIKSSRTKIILKGESRHQDAFRGEN